MQFARSAGRLSGAACLLVLASVVSSVALAQQTVPHKEECVELTWGFLRALHDEFGAVNICPEPVEIWFMSNRDGKTVQQRMEPRGTFSSGLTTGRSFDWIVAVCPAGYVPSVSVSVSNWDAIQASRYGCEKR